MATELKKVFKDDKKYCDKQKKIFEAIDKYDIEVKLNKYFTKHTGETKYGKRGNGRFAGLNWRELVFNEYYKKEFKPYTGVQIYLYAVDENEIGNISDEALERNNEINKSGKINEFPYDGPPSTRNQRLVSDNVQIDTNTGNLIKKDNSLEHAQIWFCIEKRNKDNRTEDNRIYLEDKLKEDKPKDYNNLIDKFKNVTKDINKNKEIFCNSVKNYFKELKKQKLVSDEIFFPYNWEDKEGCENNCKKIKEAIEKLLEDRIKY